MTSMKDLVDALLHLIPAIHRQEIGRVGMAYNHGVGRVAAIPEHQYSRVGCIAQRQCKVSHVLLVIDNNTVRAPCRDGERVECVSDGISVSVEGVEIAVHHRAFGHRTVGFFRTRGGEADENTEE